MLLISNLTVSGQFTPQRLTINGNPGVILTPAQEKVLLEALIDYKYCSNSILLKDSIILDLNNSIRDKNFELKLLTTKYNKCIVDSKIYAQNYNSLLEVHNKLIEEHNTLKLEHSKSINWNIGLGCSTLVLGLLLILTN